MQLKSCCAFPPSSKDAPGQYSGEEETDSYDHLETALLKWLSSDTEEDCLTTREQLFRRKLCKGGEEINELAHDLKRLLDDKPSPVLSAELRGFELRFHLMNSFPERVAFQLKLLPKGTFVHIIAKARELCLIYNSSDATSEARQIHHLKEFPT